MKILKLIIKDLVVIIITVFILYSYSTAAVYYVATHGKGKSDGSNWDNRSSLSDFNDGALGKFDSSDLNGDTICFGGELTGTGHIINLTEADDSGDEENYITIDGSASGECSEVVSPAKIISNGDGYAGIYAKNPNYIRINGFNITNGSESQSFGIKLYCISGVCRNVYATNNNLEIYGDSKNSNKSYGMSFQGTFQDLFIQGNKVTALDWDCYNGIDVKSKPHPGDLRRINISGNIVSDWAHNGIVVNLNDTEKTGSLNYLYIYDNITNQYNRAYGRGLEISSHTLGSFKYAYVYNNIFLNNRAANQFDRIEYLSFYRNITYHGRNQCGPKNPADYDAKHAGKDPYYGDSSCQESCVSGSCSESDAWGAAVGYGKGIGLQAWNTNKSIAVFQNTFYDHAEGSIQIRNTSNAANNKNIKFYGNIFGKDSLYNIGTWSPAVGGTRKYLNGPKDTNPPGSANNNCDCSFFIKNTLGLSKMEIKDNVFYTSGLSSIICREEPIGSKYTLTQAESTFKDSTLSIEENVNLDPLMIDPENQNFKLQKNSPAIDRGFWTFIDQTNGSGKSLKVVDALFLGSPGETIKTAEGKTAVIQSIEYFEDSDDIVTVEPAISWKQGEGVGLEYTGISLDAGAEEFNQKQNRKAIMRRPENLKIVKINVLEE